MAPNITRANTPKVSGAKSFARTNWRVNEMSAASAIRTEYPRTDLSHDRSIRVLIAGQASGPVGLTAACPHHGTTDVPAIQAETRRRPFRRVGVVDQHATAESSGAP